MCKPWSGRFSTRFHLFGLVAAVVIPLVIFAALVVYRYAIAEQMRIEQESIRIAAQTGLLVEAELKQLTAKLEGLVASSALSRDDLEDLHAEAALLTKGRDETIILRDLGVRQLFNSGLPFGAPLPDGPPFSAEERVNFAAGKPYVSDVYLSPRNQEPRIVIALPITRDGSTRYVIGITIPTERVRQALLSAIPAGYVVAVGDRKGAYVARSARHAEVTGKPGLPEYVQQVVGTQGSFKSPNFEGKQLLAAYYRSHSLGWFFTANIPAEAIEAPLQTSLMQLASFGGAALIASALLALLFSRRITTATHELAESARALGAGRQIEPRYYPLIEFDQIMAALVTAGEEIAARNAERARASEREALLASIFDAVGIYIGVVAQHDDGFHFVAANRAAVAMFEIPAIDVTRPTVTTLNADDPSRIEFAALVARAGRERLPFNAEFSLSVGAKNNRTCLGTFTALESVDGSSRVAFTAMDITERKRLEEHRQLLVNELNHRVKNSLAIAQSIASQTLRSAGSMQEARSALSGRLVSLANTHDILTRESWEGADVGDIVEHVVEPHRATNRIRMAGPAVRLLPGPALTLSLLLHELLTNSTKYGALSSESGEIAIDWRSTDDTAHASLVLTFKETNGPAVKEPSHKGFGSRLFAASFSSPEDGHISVDYRPGGVVCEIGMSGVATA